MKEKRYKEDNQTNKNFSFKYVSVCVSVNDILHKIFFLCF